MAEPKYSYLMTHNVIRMPGDDGVHISGTRHLDFFGDGHFNMDCVFVTHPFLMVNEAHRHDFPQYICLLSSNHSDAAQFDAEIEFSLGEEQEKYIITQPTVFYVPARLKHGPLNFVRVAQPVLLVDVALTGQYLRIGENK
jgi:hypothetical protein